MNTLGRRWTDAALISLTAAASGAGFDRAFSPPAALGVAVIAACAPVVAITVAVSSSRIGVRTGIGTIVRALCAAIALVLLYLCARGPAIDLLSTTLPLPPYAGEMVVPAGLVWFGAWLGTETALRLRRVGLLVVLLPTVPAWVYVALLGAPTTVGYVAAACAGACVLLQILRGARAAVLPRPAIAGQFVISRRDRRRWLGIPLALVITSVAVAIPLAATIPIRSATDMRDALPRDALPLKGINPLDLAGGWLADPDDILFTATATAPIPFWRLVVLDRFDGERWLPPSRYWRAGLGVPSSADGADDDENQVWPPDAQVTQTISIERLAGPFLPSADRPAEIALPVTAVEVDSGILATDRLLRKGMSYTVVSRVRTQPNTDRPCPPITADRKDSLLAYPVELSARLDNLIGGSCLTSLQDNLSQIRSALLTYRHVTPAAPRGTSIGAMLAFLDRERPGTAVEFAAVFAFALRRLALPTRLVVGFAANLDARGIYVVRASDVQIHAEARLPGGGWTMLRVELPTPEPPDSGVELPSATSEPSTAPTTSVPWLQPTPSSESGGPSVTWWVWLAIAVGVAALLYLGAVFAVPPIRRLARRADRYRRRQVLAAWHDTLDSLTAARIATVEQLSRLTPKQVSRLVSLGALAEGAELASAALERAEEPGRHQVHRARRASRAVSRHVRKRVGWRRRTLARLAPGNLRWRSPWRRLPGDR